MEEIGRKNEEAKPTAHPKFREYLSFDHGFSMRPPLRNPGALYAWGLKSGKKILCKSLFDTSLQHPIAGRLCPLLYVCYRRKSRVIGDSPSSLFVKILNQRPGIKKRFARVNPAKARNFGK